MYDQKKAVEAAKSGAKKYAAPGLDYLRQFAGIDCGSRDVEGNAKVVEIIDGMLSQIEGIKIEHHFFEGYGINIVAKLTPENPTGKIILNAHTDTVFKKGQTEEFPFRIDGDTAYGLGIIDCKGGIVVAIHAVKVMQEAGMLPNKEIVFIFNCDEEIGSPTGHQTFDKECPGAEACFVFEPSRLEDGVLTSRKGSGSITIDVTGKKAHSGVNYLDGRSAIMEVAHRMMLLYESNINDRGIQFNVGPVVNDDPANVVSGHASAKVSVRVANKADMDTVEEIVKKVNDAPPYIPDTITKVTVDRFSVPFTRTEGGVKLYEKVRRAGRLLGKDLPEQTTGGGSDANYISFMGIPCVDALGPYMYEIHSTNEHMRISSIEEKIALFAVVLSQME